MLHFITSIKYQSRLIKRLGVDSSLANLNGSVNLVHQDIVPDPLVLLQLFVVAVSVDELGVGAVVDTAEHVLHLFE